MADTVWSDNVQFPPVSSLDGSEELVGLKSANNMKTNVGTALVDYLDAVLPGESLQKAYDIGNIIEPMPSKPFKILTSYVGFLYNALNSSSTGSATSSDYVIHGFNFSVTTSGYITAFQIEDSGFTASEIQVGLFNSLGQEIQRGLVFKTDPLSGAYRTNQLDKPLFIQDSITYTFVAVVPPGQIYRTNSDASPNSNIYIPAYGVGNSQPTPIPLSYPTSFTSTQNVVPIGSFKFEELVAEDSFAVDPTNTSTWLSKVKSTIKGNIPWPSMTAAQRNAISFPEEGLTVWVNDVSPQRPYIYSGSWLPIALIGDIPIVSGGSYLPALTPLSGITGSISLVTARYSRAGTQLIITAEVSLTANASAISFGVALPPGFSVISSTQITPMGGWLTTGTPNVGDGNMVSIVGDSINNYAVITVNATVSSGVKNISFSFMVDV